MGTIRFKTEKRNERVRRYHHHQKTAQKVSLWLSHYRCQLRNWGKSVFQVCTAFKERPACLVVRSQKHQKSCALHLFLLGPLLPVAKFPLTIKLHAQAQLLALLFDFVHEENSEIWNGGKKGYVGVTVIFKKSNNIVTWLQLQYWPFSFTGDAD